MTIVSSIGKIDRCLLRTATRPSRWSTKPTPHLVKSLPETKREVFKFGIHIAAERQHETEHRHEVEQVGGDDRPSDILSGFITSKIEIRFSREKLMKHPEYNQSCFRRRTIGNQEASRPPSSSPDFAFRYLPARAK